MDDLGLTTDAPQPAQRPRASSAWVKDTSLRVVAWNLHHAVLRNDERRAAGWRFLRDLGADLALVQEAGPPELPDAQTLWEAPRTGPSDWGTALVSRHPELARFTGPVYPHYYGGKTAISLGEHVRERSIAMGLLSRPGTTPVLGISLYGTLRYSEQSVLHAAADIMPLFDDPTVTRHVILGGDLNIHTHDDRPHDRRRSGAILAVIEAIGVVNLVREARTRGVLVEGARDPILQCPCDGTDCYHVRTHKHSRHRPGEMANNDYLFASPALAERLVRLEVMNGDADPSWAHSDHCPLVADFA